MDEPATAINPSAVPREDLGRGEPLVSTSNTPIPGTYHIKTFIEESLLNPVKATYNFKNEGRKRIPLVQRNDPVPTDLPHYKPPDFLELLKKQMASYSFKDRPRANPTTLVDKDESLQLCPGQYEILPAPVSKSASRSFVFRSAVQRFPPNYFTPHEGPGPGEYNLKAPSVGSITSCFRSKVPRFLPVGSYKVVQVCGDKATSLSVVCKYDTVLQDCSPGQMVTIFTVCLVTTDVPSEGGT
ncbi:protein STPG4 [Onychomys torridus]|uniref:protein STPG4 n=1 Tax=Onychomys torridus TaxID=38674 RepID=UPI00167F71B0|nr:protein STPG4 [Onychomys torridus]